VEVVFIYNKTYVASGTGQFTIPAVEDECTKGSRADIVYIMAVAVLAGHTLNESAGTLSVVPYLHLTVADKFVFASNKADTSVDRAKTDIQSINVFPNPYYGFNTSETDRLQKYVTFNHLPQRATIRIFNLGGVILRVIEKDDPTQFLRWNLRNDNNLPVASGVYIVHIDMPDPINRTKILKVAIVQEEQILRIY